MPDLIFISRNFTELGGFSPSEIIDFQKRNILTENDFVRPEGQDQWIPLDAWVAGARDASPVKTASGGNGKVAAQRKPGAKVNGATSKKAKEGS